MTHEASPVSNKVDSNKSRDFVFKKTKIAVIEHFSVKPATLNSILKDLIKQEIHNKTEKTA